MYSSCVRSACANFALVVQHFSFCPLYSYWFCFFLVLNKFVPTPFPHPKRNQTHFVCSPQYILNWSARRSFVCSSWFDEIASLPSVFSLACSGLTTLHFFPHQSILVNSLWVFFFHFAVFVNISHYCCTCIMIYKYASQQHLAVDIKGNGSLVLSFSSRSIESIKRIM